MKLISTGGTAKLLADKGLPVTEVSALTGFPEMLDGRVKTLHPKVHGGLLARRDSKEHMAAIQEHGIDTIDLLVINLYPFTETISKSECSFDEAVENIDIGGPAMLRAAAKNHQDVTVLVSPDDYSSVLEEMRRNQNAVSYTTNLALAKKVFAHTAQYDGAIANYLSSLNEQHEHAKRSPYPQTLHLAFERVQEMRYGENPHQQAAVYQSNRDEPGLANAKQLQGKQMSYNNFVDADAARRAAFDHLEPAIAIIKHANPCGIAIGTDIADAYIKAFATDPISAFGGVVAANRTVTVELAAALGDVFTEVIVAPDYDQAALELFAAKKNLRVLQVAGPHAGRHYETRSISGGLLVQSVDDLAAPGDDPNNWRLACGSPVAKETLRDLEFAWRCVRSVKSNAILLAAGGAAVGIGMGQVNRVDSARLAVDRAGDRVRGSVAASDAFFPFADGLQVLIDAGISAVVQPGGSVRDDEVIAAAHAAGITMYFTDTRHFFH